MQVKPSSALEARGQSMELVLLLRSQLNPISSPW